MNKKVCKFVPFDYSKTCIMESWLSDKAKEGLILLDLKPFFCTFEKGEPSNTVYRIYISDDKEEISSTEIKPFRDKGWTPLTSYGRYHIFTAPSEHVASEVFKNGVDYVDMVNQKKSNALVFIIYCLALMGLYFLDLKSKYLGFYLTLAKVTWIYLIPIGLLSFFIFVQVFLYIRQRHFKNVMRRKISIDHHFPWKKELYINISVYLITFLVLSAFVAVAKLYDDNPNYISQVTTSMPLIIPEDTEPTDTLHNEKISIIEDETIFSHKYYEGRISAFVPTNYDGKYSKGYDVIIDNEFYDLKFDFLTEGVVKNLVNKNFYSPKSKVSTVKVDSPDFDELYVDEYMTICKVVAAKNNKVIYVNYFGKPSKEIVMSLIKEKLK